MVSLTRLTSTIYSFYRHIYISCRAASTDFPLSLAIRPYHSSLPVGLTDYILCLYGVVVGRFLLIDQYWHVHVKGSIRKYHMSLSLLLQQYPACLVRIVWIVSKFGLSSQISAVSWGIASRICSILFVAFWCSSRLAFSLYVLLAFMWYIRIVLPQPLLGRNSVLFYRTGQTSI